MTGTVTTLVVPPGRTGAGGAANGGYLCGMLASRVPDHRPAAGRRPVVTLLEPVPVGSALTVSDAGRHHVVEAGDRLLATVAWASATIPGLPRVSPVQARAASAGYLGRQDHPFPDCFACGPARVEDGLLLTPGPVEPGLVACSWVPKGAAESPVPAEVVWSALDCAAGWTGDARVRPAVLTRMTAEIVEPVPTGVEVVVVAGRVGENGRTVTNASSLLDPDGQVLARALTTWTFLGISDASVRTTVKDL